MGTPVTSYPADMDVECVRLCDALNALPGIMTVSSCCGHGKRPFRVFFCAATIAALLPIVRCVNSSGWRIETSWSNGSDVVMHMLEGPVGLASMLGGANDLARWIDAEAERLGWRAAS
jgi:hypothetical protein